jgi:hypothetical protein
MINASSNRDQQQENVRGEHKVAHSLARFYGRENPEDAVDRAVLAPSGRHPT